MQQLEVMEQAAELDSGTDRGFNRIAQIIGCKWSIAIFDALALGISRPGRLAKHIEGISPKVLHRCINRLELDGLISKKVFAEVPPHVEYSLTDTGQRMRALIEDARNIAAEWVGTGPYPG